jgi:membrane associated rhomboid family serine protease
MMHADRSRWLEVRIMGIYDRDYYRREGASYLESLIPSGHVCKWLIAINVFVFFLQILTNNAARAREDDLPPAVANRDGQVHQRNADHGLSVTELFWLDPLKVMKGQVWRLLTYAFLHDTHDILHIFFNMLFLWWFGSELERMYGSNEFLAFYLTAALLGGLADQGFFLIYHDPTPCLGASGAVTALLLLFACHFPHQQILIFFVLPVPIWLFVGFQVAQDTFGVLQGMHTFKATAGVVHLAGAVFGYLYFKHRWQILGMLNSLRLWRIPRSRPRLRLYRPDSSDESVAVASAGPGVLDEHLEAKLDAVLEKVARYGQASLTEAERQILLRASEIYKKNRS